MAISPAASQPKSLTIAVLGMGAIGSAFAFQLARSGHHQVTAIARPGSLRLQQLQRDSGVINLKGEQAAMQIADYLDPQISYDLILVTLLAHQVAGVLPALQQSAAHTIQFMFNNFTPESLQQAIGPARTAFGMPFIQATLNPEGKLTAVIGAGGQKCKMDRQASVDLFQASGLPAVLESNMLLWLRCHTPMCVAFESVSVAGMRRQGGASWKEATIIAEGLKESFTLIQRLGFPIYPSEKAWLHRLPSAVAATMLWTVSRIKTFRELLATGERECRALIDAMLLTANQADTPIAQARIEAMKP